MAHAYVPALRLTGVPALRQALESNGFANVDAAARAIEADSPGLTWPERELNDWGYRLLATGRTRPLRVGMNLTGAPPERGYGLRMGVVTEVAPLRTLSARTLGVLAVVGLVVAFSLSSTLVKRAETAGVLVAFWRLVVVSLASNAVLWSTGRRVTLRHVRAIPPDQLLRRVFEDARDYTEDKSMLETTPVARPVIYTLAGCRAGERCVIERTEDGFNTRTDGYGAANDWLDSTPDWEGRIGAKDMFSATFEQAAEKSRARREGLAQWQGSFQRDSFGWIAPPVLNPYTRVAVEMCPARGIVRAAGYELHDGDELARAVTLPGEFGAGRVAA